MKKKTHQQVSNKVNKVQEDTEEEGNTREMYLSCTERIQQSVQLVIHIDEGIQQPKYYRAVVERMRNLSENDEVLFCINSGGGRLDGLLSLLYGIQSTEASVVAEITGDCHSAAGILALHCDAVQVAPYASMLVHNVQFEAIGSGSEVRDMVQHTLDFSDLLLKETYDGFLTEKEIQEVQNGREMWLQSSEITARLEAKVQYLKEVEKELLDSAEKPKEAKTPKK